jgi:geranylgeranyl pyrophosphate synthase
MDKLYHVIFIINIYIQNLYYLFQIQDDIENIRYLTKKKIKLWKKDI